jgi:opacity protein-like surface antigen
VKKIILVVSMLLVAAAFASAQDEYPKFEIPVTASALFFDVDQLGNETMWGWGIAGQGNINKFFGIVGEWNANHGASIVPPSTTYPTISGKEFDLRVQTLMFGPQFSYRAKPVTVFGRFLVGTGTLKIDDELKQITGTSSTSWQVAYAIGGGLDINAGKHFAIRPIQLDYVFVDSDLPQKLGSTEAPGAFNNVRYNFGVVFKF